MNKIREDILKIENLPVGNVYELNSYQGNTRAYLTSDLNNYGVAIENINNITCNEKFMNVFVQNKVFTFNGENFNVLYLYATKEKLSDFVFLAESFLDVKNEEILLREPLVWIKKWIDLLGNSVKSYTIYDVIGELISLKSLLKNNLNYNWQASNKGVHDIEGETDAIEVKSTIIRENNIISVSSAFQLSSDKELFLYFCRFESDSLGIYSINKLVKDIIELGYDLNNLEEELKKLGYASGKSTRDEKYNLLEFRKYKVTKENFPIINLEQLNNLVVRKNIVGYKFSVDLSGIEYDNLL